MRVGEPLDLVGLDEATVTERILDAITGLVAGIRQQSPPGRWDPRRGARIG